MTPQEKWDEITLKLATDRAALLKALKGMASIYDCLDYALVHQHVMDKVTEARAAIAQAEQPPQVTP